MDLIEKLNDNIEIIEIKVTISNLLERVSDSLLNKFDVKWNSIIFGMAKETNIDKVNIKIFKNGDIHIIGKSGLDILNGVDFIIQELEKLYIKTDSEKSDIIVKEIAEIRLDYKLNTNEKIIWDTDDGNIIIQNNKIIFEGNSLQAWRRLREYFLNTIIIGTGNSQENIIINLYNDILDTSNKVLNKIVAFIPEHDDPNLNTYEFFILGIFGIYLTTRFLYYF